MNKNSARIRKTIKLLFLIILLICSQVILYNVFWPKTYNVLHLSKRNSTQYWKLSTGSTVGYTYIAAKGNKKPFPLVYLHGGPGAGINDLEIKTLTALSDDGYDIYLYDQIGCGHSERLKNINEYSAARHNKDLLAVVEKIGTEKVILIAQSWGAILSVLFFANHPEKVAAIAITSPGTILPEISELKDIKAPESLRFSPPIKPKMPANSYRTKLTQFCARTWGIKFISDYEADEWITYQTNELNKSMVCNVRNAVLAEGTEGFYVNYMTRKSLGAVQDPRPKIKNSTIPVLIMKGECDIQKWGFTNEYLELFPNHQLSVIPGGGHNIYIEQPAVYVKTLRQFLNNNALMK